jgi:hypothetical protein
VSSVVRARMHPQRSASFSMFADLTDATVLALSPDRATGEWVVEFDAVLSPEVSAQVVDRMESRDADDQANRAVLRAALAGGALNLAAIVACDRLGEPLPAPVYPEPAEAASSVAALARKSSKKS